MDFSLSDVQQSWKARARSLGRELPANAMAGDVIAGAARAGLIDPRIDLLSAVVAVEALACESAGPALAFALHSSIVLAVAGDDRFTALARGETVAAVGLSSDDVAREEAERLSGRASWVGPVTNRGLAVLGVRRAGDTTGLQAAVAVALDQPEVTIEEVQTAALTGFVCGHVTLRDAPFMELGSPLPIMARVRVLLAAAGLGMGRRALREALQVARTLSHRGAGGEQTVQGLLADAATELDAATMLTWKAATADDPELGEASMAKLAATEATQRAVARATQVVGADSFRAGHVVERLARDVRALELFAGRTEALREAVAEQTLPRGNSAHGSGLTAYGSG
jgi:alkylation response protein AidB-like acyl-CoA dehydrogenase